MLVSAAVAIAGIVFAVQLNKYQIKYIKPQIKRRFTRVLFYPCIESRLLVRLMDTDVRAFISDYFDDAPKLKKIANVASVAIRVSVAAGSFTLSMFSPSIGSKNI